MLKFVVPHNIFSVFHHLCLLFGLELRLGFSVYPPTPRTPPLPVLVLHVFLWPGRVSCEQARARAQAPRRALIFPDYFFCSITFLWPPSRSRSRTRLFASAVVGIFVVGFFLAILCMNAGVLMLQTFSLACFHFFWFCLRLT